MVSRRLDRIGGRSVREDSVPRSATFLPLPTNLISSAIRRVKSLSHKYPGRDSASSSTQFDSQAAKFLHPLNPNASLPKTKLKLAPSGAIVFNPIESEESLIPPSLPRKAARSLVYTTTDR